MKLTPLTTRPPVTSRQGMMRLASIVPGLFLPHQLVDFASQQLDIGTDLADVFANLDDLRVYVFPDGAVLRAHVFPACAVLHAHVLSHAAHLLPECADLHQANDQAGQHSDHWQARSEERRVGKECRSRWSPY